MWLNHKLNKNINILTLLNYLFSMLFIHLFVLFSWIWLGGSGHIQTQSWYSSLEWLWKQNSGGDGKETHHAGSQYETIIPTVTTVKI